MPTFRYFLFVLFVFSFAVMHPSFSQTDYLSQGDKAFGQKQYEQAAKFYELALAQVESIPLMESSTHTCLDMLIETYHLLGRTDDEAAAITKQKKVILKKYGPTSRQMCQLLWDEARYLHAIGDERQALALEGVAKTIPPGEARPKINFQLGNIGPYRRDLLKRIEKIRPELVLIRDKEAVLIYVLLTLEKQGELKKIWIDKGCGDNVAEEKLLNFLKTIQYEPLPTWYTGNDLTFRITIRMPSEFLSKKTQKTKNLKNN